jgi:hypothetical protein
VLREPNDYHRRRYLLTYFGQLRHLLHLDILFERLKRAKHKKDAELIDRINHISPVAWKQINSFGEYTFPDTDNVINLTRIIDIAYFLNRI